MSRHKSVLFHFFEDDAMTVVN